MKNKKKNKNKTFSYPEINDEHLQTKIFRKREFYYHRVPPRNKLNTYEEIENYRNAICSGELRLREQQMILSNLISPYTPYNGLVVMHGTGTGKTCGSISVAEQFKEQVKKYNTKIFVLVPGPNNRETWRSELLTCTGETYLKKKYLLSQMNKNEINREKKIAQYAALQYYKIMSYKTFYKKVLGEKIREHKIVGDNKIKTSYRKTVDGEFEREIVVDRITNMDNTLLIIDEAHNVVGNQYGEALKKIIKVSKNLKVLFLTATPMKNRADSIVDLVNFLKPDDEKLSKEHFFTSDKVYQLEFKPNGEEKLKKYVQGYVSYFRGMMPYTFAKRKDKGVIPKGLLFTPVVKCTMEKFQLEAYEIAANDYDDSLDRKSSAASNFVIPGLSKNDNKKIVGYSSNDGINTILGQLNVNGALLKKTINKVLFKGKLSKSEEDNFIKETETKNISGTILNLKYIRMFSIKFYKALRRLTKLVEGNKEPGTAFIYSNLVRAGGMEIFAESLKENGFLEYKENFKEYNILDNTVDYKTGKSYLQFKKEKRDLSKFKPATYILVTGSVDESGEDLPEIKQRIIREVFNSSDNIDGKHIKFILGSQVMNEGITLENVREVHILDVHYNLGRVDQVIGRAIRQCKHQESINDENKFPQVNIYRYVVAKKNNFTTDEILYKKAEKKYLLVKKVERLLKEGAIDCPMLINGNIFPEEIEQYKDCVEPTAENVKKKKKICPALCDFKPCQFKCNDDKLNKNFGSKNKIGYKNLDKSKLDFSTFNDKLADHEIKSIKLKIKDLYQFSHVYIYPELLKKIKKTYSELQKELFMSYFLDKALEDLMPKTENDYNNFQDTLYDKHNTPGYLIQRGIYYIFQPFHFENKKIPMHYRKSFDVDFKNHVSLDNYLQKNFKSKIKTVTENKNSSNFINKKKKDYNFKNTLEYYNGREDNFIVGIISKNLNKLASSSIDLFKIRNPRKKNPSKKRGTGIPTLTGAVCSTSKEKGFLLKQLQKLPNTEPKEIKENRKKTRTDICESIREKLLYLEKYSEKSKKITYMMIPYDHPTFQFPYNLIDRIEHTKENLIKFFEKEFTIDVKKENNGIFLKKRIKKLPKYILSFKNKTWMVKKDIEKMNGELDKKGIWNITIE
jgi:hypothetical protein